MSNERQVPRSGSETPSVTEPLTGEELNRLWADPPGLWGQLTGVQNDKIGARLLLTGFFFVLLGQDSRHPAVVDGVTVADRLDRGVAADVVAGAQPAA